MGNLLAKAEQLFAERVPPCAIWKQPEIPRDVGHRRTDGSPCYGTASARMLVYMAVVRLSVSVSTSMSLYA